MQREKGFVSVIIPCYNHGAYIRDTLQSILNQTFCDYEVIIVDDGSDDQFTVEVLEEIDHPKVTVLHKENGHVSSARNYGIRHSRGEFILTLDADDQFMPEFLEKAIRVLQENSEIGSVTCYAYKFDHKGNIRKHHKYGGGVESFLDENNSLASALYRFQCWQEVGGYNERMTNGYEDWDFWLSVTAAGWKIYSIPEYLYWYRDSPNSLNKIATAKRPALMKEITQMHEPVFKDNVIDVLYRKEWRINKLQEIYNSRPYKIGHFLFAPVRLIRFLLSKKYHPKEIPTNNYINKEIICSEKKTLSV